MRKLRTHAMHLRKHRPVQLQRGFTLVELVMVIVIMGVIGGIVSVFMKSPIDAYFASARRAALTDTADTVVRRMARDIQRSLPNSIRTSGASCLEFIPTKTGGRYRAQEITSGDDTSLNFSAADSTFNMLGSNTTFAGKTIPTDQQIGRGDVIVVYNLGIPGADAYEASPNNRTQVSLAAPVPLAESSAPVETTIPIVSKLFPLASGSNRFQVVDANEQMVSYVCSGSDLLRSRSTAMTTSASCPTVTSSTAFVSVIASHVDCAATNTWFNYSGSDLMRNALLSMALTIKDSNSSESVTLQHEVHVSNTP